MDRSRCPLCSADAGGAHRETATVVHSAVVRLWIGQQLLEVTEGQGVVGCEGRGGRARSAAWAERIGRLERRARCELGVAPVRGTQGDPGLRVARVLMALRLATAVRDRESAQRHATAIESGMHDIYRLAAVRVSCRGRHGTRPGA